VSDTPLSTHSGSLSTIVLAPLAPLSDVQTDRVVRLIIDTHYGGRQVIVSPEDYVEFKGLLAEALNG
jgi:hypothetical protein